MNRRMIGACVVVLSMLAALAGTAAPAAAPDTKIDPAVLDAIERGENPVDVIVTGFRSFRPMEWMFGSRKAAMTALNADAAPFFDAVRRVAAETGSSVLEQWAAAPAIHVIAKPAAVERFNGMEKVRWVEYSPEDAVRIAPIDDEGVGAQNTGGRQMIQAEDIWALGYRGEGIKIAMIDTGIDGNHSAFKFADGSSRIVAWRDFTSHGYQTPTDGHGHGTHVSGTSTGSRLYNDPSSGYYQEEGVAPRAILMGAKNLGDFGSGQWPWSLSALQWAYDNGADITSNSWGGGCSTDAIAVTALVRTLTDLGMLSVIAAGNSGTFGLLCPGRGESALTVGAVDQSRVIAGFSSRGPCTDPDLGTPSRICPDVVAKGVSVRSAWRGGGYNTISGTSMATPHVAGAAVLAEQMKRALTGTGFNTPGRVEEALFKATSLDLGSAGPDNAYGWGLVQLLNIRNALAPRVDMKLNGFAADAMPVVPQALTFTASNPGTKTAFDVSVQVAVPAGYVFVPGANFDPADLNTLYSDPAPDTATTAEDGSTILTYNLGTFAVGDTFSFAATVAALLPGSHLLTATSAFKDSAGAAFSETVRYTQQVGPVVEPPV